MTGEAENSMSYEYTLLEKFAVSRFPVLHQKCNLKTFQKLEKKKTKQELALAQKYFPHSAFGKRGRGLNFKLLFPSRRPFLF